MIPAIWLGNFALVYLYKKLLLEKQKNYFLSGITGIIVKVAIIYLSFSTINIFGIFPQKLVQNLQTAMGLTQAVTATVGMIVAYTVYIANKEKVK